MQELESVHASDARANAGTHEAQTRQPRSIAEPGWSAGSGHRPSFSCTGSRRRVGVLLDRGLCRSSTASDASPARGSALPALDRGRVVCWSAGSSAFAVSRWACVVTLRQGASDGGDADAFLLQAQVRPVGAAS